MFLASASTSSGAGSAFAGIVFILIGVAAYWSPTIAGALMRKHNLGVIATWNFFGFFFLFPFIMAWVKVAERPQQPVVIMQSPYGLQPYGPPHPPPPGFQPPAPQPQSYQPPGQQPQTWSGGY